MDVGGCCWDYDASPRQLFISHIQIQEFNDVLLGWVVRLERTIEQYRKRKEIERGERHMPCERKKKQTYNLYRSVLIQVQ
jgi:hypothetical protein